MNEIVASVLLFLAFICFGLFIYFTSRINFYQRKIDRLRLAENIADRDAEKIKRDNPRVQGFTRSVTVDGDAALMAYVYGLEGEAKALQHADLPGVPLEIETIPVRICTILRNGRVLYNDGEVFTNA